MTNLSYDSIKRKKKLKAFTCIIIMVIIAMIILLVTRDNQTANSGKKQTLSISGPWEISSIDPAKQGYILTRMQVTETLLNINDKGEITPGLATHWQRQQDGLNWIFTLRKGVTFHDGSIMNAESVVRSLNYAYQKHGALNKADIAEINAIGDDQVNIRLSKPYAAFPSLLTHYSNAILAPASYLDNGIVAHLYGSGAYQMDSFSPPHKLKVKQFDHYWGEKGKIAFATYLTGHRAESRLLQAKSGEVDIAFTLDPSMLNQLTASKDVSVITYSIPRTLFVKLNAGLPFFNEVKARKALSLAIDRQAIAKNVMHVENSQTTQLLPKSMSEWFIEGIKPGSVDLIKAQSMLEELGWQRNQNGILERDGQLFKLTMLTFADRPELIMVATALQAQWAKLGIELKIDLTNSSMIPAGHQDGTLEMALISRNLGANADPLPIISTDFAKGGGDWGAMNWDNADMDKALTQLINADDESKNHQLKQQISLILYQELPILPITTYSQHIAINKRIKHFKFDPFERDYYINQLEIN